MPTSLVIGSGPAAAGVVLALSAHRDQHITMIDVGGRLEPNRAQAVDQLRALPSDQWPTPQVDLIRQQPVAGSARSLPEKRTYGSDFAFRDFGQLQGLVAEGSTNRAVISGAYGGFSNSWGAQIMPFSSAAFDRWPITCSEMERHYKAVLAHVPLSGAVDDLAELFPLLVTPTPLPPVSARTSMVLNAYAKHRHRLRGLGIVLGHARLAIRAERCVRCGLCMTGCPYSLIYSSSQTIDEFRRSNRIDYVGGALVFRVGEDDTGAVVDARLVGSGKNQTFRADRVFVACGAIGTTRLVLGSLGDFGRDVTLEESVQFILPALSRYAVPDPRGLPDFTLNQFNMVVGPDAEGDDLSQIHFYPYNPAYLDALPPFFSRPGGRALGAQFLRRLSVGLGYLPSSASPRLRLRATAGAGATLPDLHLAEDAGSYRRPPMLRAVLRQMRRGAPWLDLWPVTPKVIVSAGAKSYHFGGSFPHSRAGRVSNRSTDRTGRLARWRRIHLVDGSVFPTVPAMTFTLTVMGNAHRIAEESLGLRDG